MVILLVWRRAWLVLSISAITSAQEQQTNNAGQFHWGWQLQSPGDAATSGQYYLRLPQSEQSVRYAADGSGYHGAVAINTNGEHHSHSAAFALGQRALDLLNQQDTSIQHQQPQTSQNAAFNNGQPLEIFLLKQHFSVAPEENQRLQQTQGIQYDGISNYYNNVNSLIPPSYYVVQPTHDNTQESILTNAKHGSSKPLVNKEEKTESSNGITPVVQVFKDANCTHEKDSSNKAKTNRLLHESRHAKYINGKFGAKVTEPLHYKGSVNFKVEVPDDRQNARSEKVYYTTEFTTASPHERKLTDEEGISKLVASTQDLISNEDLLTINHAFEKSYVHNDDLIKPVNKNVKAEGSVRYEYVQPYSQQQTNTQEQQQQKHFTVKAKLENILDRELDHLENNKSKDEVLQSDSNQYTFANPIVVEDSDINDYKEQVVNNIVSTVAPYLDEGYEVKSIRNTGIDLNKYDNLDAGGFDGMTSRPIGQRYLAPITVGLRLLNANDTEVFNTLDDYEGSDSELVSEAVKSPVREKTIVEIQESIPVEITHYNDVEHHTHYLEDGKSDDQEVGNLDAAKSLYNKYMQALESSRKIQENMNENLYKYGSSKDHENSEQTNENEESDNKDGGDHLESSANIQTEVEIHPHEDSSSNERSEFIRHYSHGGRYGNKIIQPIVIEKEVPVTKYVDRYIEKKVPYPQRVEVIKEVDKPFVLPVPYEKIVEKPVHVTQYVDKPFPVHYPQPYPIEIQVPYPIEQKVFIDRPVHIPYTVEKVVEKQVLHPVPVPTPVAVPVEVSVEKQVLYPVPINRPYPVPVEVEKTVEKIVEKPVPVPYAVEKKVPYPVPYETKVPVPYPVEKRVPYPVEKIVEKPYPVTQFVEKPVKVEVPVPQPYPVPVRYPQPYPVDRIVEKKVPYPVQVNRIVEKRVPVQVPYTVEKVVEKIVEKPVVVTKYVNRHYPVETRVPYPVETIVEKKVPYPVQVPVEVKVPYPVEKIVEKPVHIPVKVPYAVEKYVPIFYSNSIQKKQQQIDDQQRQSNEQKEHIQQLHKDLEELQKNQEESQKPVIQSTRWGNHYASSYQYTNQQPRIKDFKKTQSLANYLNYITNNHKNYYNYYGPPPLESSEDVWGRNSGEYQNGKLRRTDRTAKMMNLRIEYGFKPPLIPSTEVDLDGIPVNKDEQT